MTTEITPTDPAAAIALEVRETRARLGLTLAQLGERIGVREQTVWRWENGRARPNKSSRKRLRRLK